MENIYDNGQKDVLLFARKYRRCRTEENHPKKESRWLVGWFDDKRRQCEIGNRDSLAVLANFQRLFIVITAVSSAYSCQACSRPWNSRWNERLYPWTPRDFQTKFLLEAPSTLVKLPLCNRGRNGISLQEDIVFAFVEANCECLNFGTNSRWNYYYCRFTTRLQVAFLVKATTVIISNLDLFTLSYPHFYHVKWYLMEALSTIEAN